MIDVPPGTSNFRNVTLMLTPRAGTTSGNYPFIVTAVSQADHAVTPDEGNTFGRVERVQNARVIGNVQQAAKGQNDKPNDHHGAEEPGDLVGAARLHPK